MSTEGLNLQSNVEGLVLGNFNGGHSGNYTPGDSFTKTKEFDPFHNFCICSLQQQFVDKDNSGGENKGGGVGSPELQVFQLIYSHVSFLCQSHLGGWEAVVVEGGPPLLNLTLHSSCGLIFGRMDKTRWQPSYCTFTSAMNKRMSNKLSEGFP